MVRINKRTVVLFASFFFALSIGSIRAAAPDKQAVLVVKASAEAELESKLIISGNNFVERIERSSIRTLPPVIPIADTYLTIGKKGFQNVYTVDRKGILYNTQSNEMLDLDSQTKAELLRYVEYARAAHYGQLVPWDKAKDIVPNKKYFKVIDLETGLAFNVQRRAGRHHADVQPLTKTDTAIMKRIYHGKWSWQRKAILVQSEQQLLAASMHGMPHGGDGIPDNDFSGHFCIHFLGSTTHKTRSGDPEHQLMVRKAGGTLAEYFDRASPYQIVDSYFSALNLHDSQLLKMSFADAKQHDPEALLELKGEIEGIHRKSIFIEQDVSGLISLDIAVEAVLKQQGQRAETANLRFLLKRTSLFDPWKIDSVEKLSGPKKR